MTTKNELTLLIDGNWFWMSRLFVISDKFSKDLPDRARESSKYELQDLLARSISLMLTRNPAIDNIIITADGGSWRKDLPIPKQLEDVTYKGNRGPVVDIDWDLAYETLNEFLTYAAKQGITVSRGYNIEGDDWMWYWTRRLNEEGISTLIWSSDCDLKQLIQMKGAAFTAWFNDRAGLYLPLECKAPDDPMEYFMRPPIINQALVQLQKTVQSIEYINPDDIAINKILCGDAGDNIKAVVRWKKGSRTYRFAPKDYEKIVEDLNLTSMQQLLESHDAIADHILGNPKFSPFGFKKEDIDEMLTYNTKLVWLNEQVLPDTVTSKMVEQEYKLFDVSELKLNYKLIVKPIEKVDIEDIFSGAE